MKKAVGYCRYSSNNQREESIEAQMRAIKQYCLNKNIELISFYKDEAISGTSIKDRENFLEMISESKNKKFDFVIVHKFDRFARNRYDHAMYERKLNENNVMLLSVLEEMFGLPVAKLLMPLFQTWEVWGLLELIENQWRMTSPGRYWYRTMTRLILRAADYMCFGLPENTKKADWHGMINMK